MCFSRSGVLSPDEKLPRASFVRTWLTCCGGGGPSASVKKESDSDEGSEV